MRRALQRTIQTPLNAEGYLGGDTQTRLWAGQSVRRRVPTNAQVGGLETILKVSVSRAGVRWCACPSTAAGASRPVVQELVEVVGVVFVVKGRRRVSSASASSSDRGARDGLEP